MMLSTESPQFISDLKRKWKGWKREVYRSQMLFLITYFTCAFPQPHTTLPCKGIFKTKWLYESTVKVALIIFCDWISEAFLFIYRLQCIRFMQWKPSRNELKLNSYGKNTLLPAILLQQKFYWQSKSQYYSQQKNSAYVKKSIIASLKIKEGKKKVSKLGSMLP